ncbi:hypothetical protein [Faecalibaculum rodentium]|uniref:hypothetical protein n=1 Tax=Faecalibaculum rodentium TaxID=1702221 RepID=UPI0023EF7FFA|nr:hypothetical protein [Faecalibaculum rodentium]
MTEKEIRRQISENRVEIRFLQRTNQGVEVRRALIKRNHQLMQLLDNLWNK